MIAIAAETNEPWRDCLSRHLVEGRPARRFPFQPATRSSLPARPQQVVVDAPTMDHASVMRFAPGPNAHDLRAIASAKLYHEALCEGMSAPLMNELRGQHALSYSVSSSLIDRGDLWDQLFEVEPAPNRVNEAIARAQALWQNKELLEQEDFERARAQLRTSERIHAIDAARALSITLREAILRGRPITWRDQLQEMRETLQMEEVINASRGWGLAAAPLATVIIGPAKALPKSLRADAISVEQAFDPERFD